MVGLRIVKCRDTVQSLALSGQTLVCGLQNGEVQVWSLTSRSLDCVAGYHGTAVTAVAVSDTRPAVILSGSWRQEVKLYNYPDHTQLPAVRLSSKLVRCISVSGRTAAVGSVDIESEACGVSCVTVVEVSGGGGEVRRIIQTGPGLSVLDLGGERVTCGGEGWLGVWRLLERENYTRQVYNKQDGSRVTSWTFPGGWVSALLHLGEGRVLVGDGQGRVTLYLQGQEVVRRPVFPSPVTSLANTEDVVVVATFKDLLVWDRKSLLSSPPAVTELQRLRSETPLTGAVVSDLCLITSLADGAVTIHDFSSPGQSGEEREEREVCALCGSSQDTPGHYFLQCPALLAPRRRLLHELESVVEGFRLLGREEQLEVILYGVECQEQALAVRDAVQNFVVRTKT